MNFASWVEIPMRLQEVPARLAKNLFFIPVNGNVCISRAAPSNIFLTDIRVIRRFFLLSFLFG